MKLRLAAPSVLVDVGRVDDLRYVRDAGDHVAVGALSRHRDLETTRAPGVPGPDPAPVPPARSATPRSATAAPSAARWPTPTRPRTCPRWCWRWAPRSWPAVRRASGRSRPADFFQGFLESALAEDELLCEIRIPKLDVRGLVVPEVQPPGPGLGHRRRRRGAGRRRHRRRAGEHGLHAAVLRGRGRRGGRWRLRRRGGRAGRRGHRAPERHQRLAPPTAPTSPGCWCAGRCRRPVSPDHPTGRRRRAPIPPGSSVDGALGGGQGRGRRGRCGQR